MSTAMMCITDTRSVRWCDIIPATTPNSYVVHKGGNHLGRGGNTGGNTAGGNTGGTLVTLRAGTPPGQRGEHRGEHSWGEHMGNTGN